MPLRALVATILLALALLVPGAAESQGSQALTGTVGPGFTISLTDASGAAVTRVTPGAYTITVRDQSAIHNFHLSGPGVEQSTAVETVGETTWNVTFADGGVYRYVCDPHVATMVGSFSAGPASSPPAATTSATPAAPARVQNLTGMVGPAATISLNLASGARAATVRAGTYRVTVRDRSSRYSFRLRGPGVNRTTGVAFRGTRTWTVALARGVYRYSADGNARLGGTLRVTVATGSAHAGH